MADIVADIVIDSVQMTPNPVDAGGLFLISVGVKNKVTALVTAEGKYLVTESEQVIETEREM